MHDERIRSPGHFVCFLAALGAALTLGGCSDAGASKGSALDALLADPRFEVHDGKVYFEGDIVLGPVERVLEQLEKTAFAVEAPGQGTRAAGVFDRSERFQGDSMLLSGTPWPNNTVPELISFGHGRLNVLVRGMDDAVWHKSYNAQWFPSLTGFDFHGGVISW